MIISLFLKVEGSNQESSTWQHINNHSQYKIYEDEVVLIVHSGSRGYGTLIFKYFNGNGGYDSTHEDDPAGDKVEKA